MCHGSRDDRATRQFQQFVNDCQRAFAPQPVAGCQLELASERLSQQLISAVEGTTRSITDVVVVPVLMAAGVHVREDIPAEVDSARTHYPTIAFHLAAPLGQTPQLLDILQLLGTAMPGDDAWVLWGHGSRRATFAAEFDGLCDVLAMSVARPVLAAFGKQEPSLEDRVRQLYLQGHQRISVLTCLLFPGRLSDCLVESAEQISAQFPQLQLTVSPVLMPHPLWIDGVRGLLAEFDESQRLGERQEQIVKLDAA